MESDGDDCFSEPEAEVPDQRVMSTSPPRNMYHLVMNSMSMETEDDSKLKEEANDKLNSPSMHFSTAVEGTMGMIHESNNGGSVFGSNSGYTSSILNTASNSRFSTTDSVISVDEPMQNKELREEYIQEKDACTKHFDMWSEQEQIDFVQHLLSRMCHHQHGQINSFLKPMLQRDFITALPELGMPHVAENILTYLDAKSLCAAELVCRAWYRVIQDGMLWKRLIERNVRTDSLWKGLSERRGW